MKYTAQIFIDRPLEKVFLWMFQPKHMVQLVTRDPTKKIISNELIPSEFIERVANRWQLQEGDETEIEIQDLSASTLQAGTSFQYFRGVRDRDVKDQPGELPTWKSPITSGSITIKEAVPPTSFIFTTKGFVPSAEHHLSFHAQQGKTMMSYTQLFPFGKLLSMLVSAFTPGSAVFENQVVPITKEAIPFGNELVRQQLMLLKSQMEIEID